MSETSPIGLIAPMHDCLEGSCGVNVPNTLLKVADVKTGEPLGPNQRGEICLKGPQVGTRHTGNFVQWMEKISLARLLGAIWLHQLPDITCNCKENISTELNHLSRISAAI